MKLRRQSGNVFLMLAALVATILLGGAANAGGQAYRVIYDFGQGSSDGWLPVGVPAIAKNGDLYGVTASGGTYNWGTVFKLTAPQAHGGAWTETVLHDFPSDSQEFPESLVIDKDGTLYGTGEGPSTRGFIFRLTPPISGYGSWTYQTLYTFQSSADGDAPQGDLVFDAEGNLYGATQAGGELSCGQNGGCGTVFELKRPTQVGGKWRFSVLHTFTGIPDGIQPFAGVTFDQKGSLYGTTNWGGPLGSGAVYRLTPPAKKGRPWTETVLYSFAQDGPMGSHPEGPVILDGSGNVYGTTAFGGDANCQGGFGCGVVFELSPPAQKGGAWTDATLHAFQGGNDGIDPSGYMLFDSKGNLYGTAQVGGAGNGGIVYGLKPPAHKGGAWTETVLHAFTGSNGDGNQPASGLTWGKWNYLYGVTAEGGSACQAPGCGTAFELQP